MTDISRRRLALAAAGTGLSAMLAPARAQQPKPALQPIVYAFATKSMSPIVANIVIPEILGYYGEEGITVNAIPLGSNATVMATLDSKRAEFGVGVPSFQLPIIAKGEKLNVINVMEHTYPSKYGLAVMPGSPFKTIEDLKGKRLGVSGLGESEYQVGRAVMRLIGLNGDTDVSWLAVGENGIAGEALRRGDVDALFYYDTGFGAIEALGIALRYIPLPANLPKVGGLYISTTPAILREHRPWVVGVARGMLKSRIFIQENPEAAAYAFLKMYPESAPKGKTVQEQVNALMAPIVKRAPLFTNYDKSGHKPGYINAEEWTDEITFAGLGSKLTPKDAEILYTNSVIDEANAFDAEKIRREAKNYPLPYKK